MVQVLGRPGVCMAKWLMWAPAPGGCILVGGDPAAGSPTATLLRLHPSH